MYSGFVMGDDMKKSLISAARNRAPSAASEMVLFMRSLASISVTAGDPVPCE